MRTELVTLQITYMKLTERPELTREIKVPCQIALDGQIFIPPDEFKKALLAAGKYAALRTA